MGALIVVDGDPVHGTDIHLVQGQLNVGGQTVQYAGKAAYGYVGSMTGGLSDLVRIDGSPVAVTASTSTLDPGEDSGPGGGHWGPGGSDFDPKFPPGGVQVPNTMAIADPIGTGVPNAGAGSGLLSVDGVPVLLDGQPIDTCSGVGATAGSTVTAVGQDFVTCAP